MQVEQFLLEKETGKLNTKSNVLIKEQERAYKNLIETTDIRECLCVCVSEL